MQCAVRAGVVTAVLAVIGLLAAACGDGGAGGDAAERPTVVVTTSILGDVVEHLVGDVADVETVMPPGADPHAFQPSARQVARIRAADAVVANGGGFEAGLDDVIASASRDGVPTFRATEVVEPLATTGHAEDDGHDHDHDDEGGDPHFFTDPARMRQAAEGAIGFLAEALDGVDPAVLERAAAPYLEQLAELDADVERLLAPIPADHRVLVTTHEVFGPFADRYGFEVVGTVIPAGSTADGASAGGLAELARRIERAGVPAIFTDASTETDLVRTLAEEARGVEVVELFTEALGPPGSDGATYVDLMRTNARRIADALGGEAP